MRLLAISDLHLALGANRSALDRITARPDDWLIVAGDVGETLAHVEFAWTILGPRFGRLIWVPGNHELWTRGEEAGPLRGAAKYERLVDLCRRYGVLTPEDPYALWPEDPEPTYIAPLFLLYDYTFLPDDVPIERAVEWAAETDVVCADELLLDPSPFASRTAWCHARCADASSRLDALPAGSRTVLVNHYPLRRDLAHLPRIPRFSIWCGTRRTEVWHQRYRARVVVSGHLHLRSTRWRDGVRFEEVSLGYPRQWRPERGVDAYLREIL